MQVSIRPAVAADADGIWQIIEPVIRAGETYTLPRDMKRQEALDYWFAPDNDVYVVEDKESRQVVGTYFLRANQRGGGDHVANCGYMTAGPFWNMGLARLMCTHSLQQARFRGFRFMQFNFVVSTNEAAARLWEKLGLTPSGVSREHSCILRSVMWMLW